MAAQSRRIRWTSLLLLPISFVVGGQQCYYGPGAAFRGPSELVPCVESGESACCLLGDTCLSGNTCYNYNTGDLYQYGCTDETYSDPTCPYKCGWNATLSPWTALEFCNDLGSSVTDTWTCHAPESCGCEWNATYGLLELAPIGCKQMGSNARVALYAPSELVPYVSLPSTNGGSTGYYSGTTISGTSTWISTAINGYTPASIGPMTTYKTPAPTKPVLIDPNQTPAPSTLPAAISLNATVTPAPNSRLASSSSSSTSTSSSSKTRISAAATSTPAAASSGLTSGAKIGIGVGVGIGGACLLVLLAIFIFMVRKRKAKEARQHADAGPYDQDKPPDWQHGQASPPPPGPYGYSFDPNYSGGAAYQGQPAMIHEAPSPPSAMKPFNSPPMELPADTGASEMSSSPALLPDSPSPEYREADRMKDQNEPT